MSEKKKPLPWVEYLLNMIELDQEKVVNDVGFIFRRYRADFVAGKITEQQVRCGLEVIASQVVEACRAKHHVKLLLASAIDYIIDPDQRIVTGL